MTKKLNIGIIFFEGNIGIILLVWNLVTWRPLPLNIKKNKQIGHVYSCSDEELQISIKERSQNPAGMAQTPRRKGEVER